MTQIPLHFPILIFAPDDPEVLDGTYDEEGWKPGERARVAKGKQRMAKQAAAGRPEKSEGERGETKRTKS